MRGLTLSIIRRVSLFWLIIGQVSAETDTGNNQQTVAETFSLQQRYGSTCLEIVTEDLDEGTCVHRDPVNPAKCYPRNRAALVNCNNDKPEQLWVYSFDTKRVHDSAYPASMCLSRMVASVELWPCISDVHGQTWSFDQVGLLTSSADFEGRGSYLYLLKGYSSVVQPLQFKYLYFGQWDCYRSPVDGELKCDKDGFGDNVIWKPEPEPEPEAEPDPEPVDWGEKPTDLYWLSERVTNDIKIIARESRYCLALDMPEQCETGELTGEACYEGVSVIMKPCSGREDRIWQHDVTTKRLFNKLAGYTYCLTWLNNKLSMKSCFAGGSIIQKWYFARGRNQVSFDYKRLRYITARKQYDFQKVLEVPDLPQWQEFELEYQLQPGTSPNQGCGTDPVTGNPMEQCP